MIAEASNFFPFATITGLATQQAMTRIKNGVHRGAKAGVYWSPQIQTGSIRMSESKLSGHCYCGAVSFEVSGSSDWIGHCHCESCRRHSGSVMTTFAGFRPDQVTFTGATPNRFSSDDGVTRSFCGKCGSPVCYESTDQAGSIHLHLGLFDDLEPLKPMDHSFLDEKASWFSADEHLPESGWQRES